jgi:hypothetical protein
MVDMRVVGEAIQPRQEGSTLPPIPPDRFPSFEEHVLGEIFGFGMAASAEVHVPVHPLDKTIVKFAECMRVSRDDDTVDKRDYGRIVRAFTRLAWLCSCYRQRV